MLQPDFFPPHIHPASLCILILYHTAAYALYALLYLITAIMSCLFPPLSFWFGCVFVHSWLFGVLVTRVARMLIDSATAVGHGGAGALP